MLYSCRPPNQNGKKRGVVNKSHLIYQLLSDFEKTGAVVNMSDKIKVINGAVLKVSHET